MAKNKYLNGILPMFLINFAIGSVYCWTLFKDHIHEYTGFSYAVTEWSFSLAIFCLGMSAAFGGKIVERDPNKSALWTAITFTTGWILTGLGIYLRSAPLTIVSFGLIQGIGLGLGYITPVKTMMLWMQNHKGFAAGLSIAAFGLAGLIANPIIGVLLDHMPVYTVFWVLAGVYGVGLVVAWRLLWRPPVPDEPEKIEGGFSPRKVLFSPKFILLWVVVFLNIAAGLALISQEKQIYDIVHRGQALVIPDLTSGDYLPMSIIVIFTMITATANLTGRLGMASLQDRMRHKHTPYYIMASASAIAAFVVVLVTSAAPSWLVTSLVLIFVVQFFFGTGFACLPNILHQNWGMKYLSTVHGYILSAWAIAGLVGNQFARFMIDAHGLRSLYIALGAVYVVELGALLIWVRVRRRDGHPHAHRLHDLWQHIRHPLAHHVVDMDDGGGYDSTAAPDRKDPR